MQTVTAGRAGTASSSTTTTINPHEMDYFMWLLRRRREVILVDTGYDRRRGPPTGTGRSGVDPVCRAGGIRRRARRRRPHLIVTHLHYDHAGGWRCFPTPPCTCRPPKWPTPPAPACATTRCACRSPTDHVCEAVRRLYAGKVIFHDGDAEMADGVTVHRIGGHSRGLQAVRVMTDIRMRSAGLGRCALL
jgi:glyoxylase-like metal-dependent hydrolase (beta-lactamase superfamily II)